MGKPEIQPLSTCSSSGFTRYADASDNNIDTPGNNISTLKATVYLLLVTLIEAAALRDTQSNSISVTSDSDRSCCTETTRKRKCTTGSQASKVSI